MDARVAAMTPTERTMAAARMRHKGLLMVWQQSDEHGPMTELERAMFLIDRLYPEMPPQHRAQFEQRFTALWEAGTWHGFQRPAPFDQALATADPMPATKRGSTP